MYGKRTGFHGLLAAMPALRAMLLGLLLSGCSDDGGNPFVLSIHALYTSVDLDFDPLLVGKWTDDDGEVTFCFEKSDGQSYKLAVVERGSSAERKAEFEAHLVRLGASQFLDIYPVSLEGGSGFYQSHFLRVHTIARVWIESDRVKIAFLSSEWLRKRLEDKSVDAAHEYVEKTPVLSGATEEVQSLANLYANDEQAFPDVLELRPVEEETKEEE